MNKLFLIFNHYLTKEQEEEAKNKLDVSQIISLPEDLQNFWCNIPPDIDLTDDMFLGLTQFLIENKSDVQNFCLVQGDFGATVYMVSWCLKNGFIPIYATTKRAVQEIRKPDGSVEIVKFFKHERFRRYIICYV
ncbi:hypothetical protein TKV_c17400 [Thermoanaerobacter kivui]|uniref:CRISPR-associated protein n=1 Tax=Thermoanaerobacter kivui TaxID=2325 RepID=A0A097ASX6_THEKI|nr:CRISPR-associated protein Csx20 [Thermoanaerobacter kivui]AIS52892.1 hypothetical protein TKV_c17400 [Thermoanaerobacter kivui]